MADAVGQAEVGKEGDGPAGMTCLVYSQLESKCRLSCPILWGQQGKDLCLYRLATKMIQESQLVQGQISPFPLLIFPCCSI